MIFALIRSTFCQKSDGRRPEDKSRRGAVIVLTAFLMIAMLAMVAFALDIGYILVAKTELQQAADSAAMAAVWELIDEQAPTGSPDPTSTIYDARQIALQYAGLNTVTGDSPLLAMVLVSSTDLPNEIEPPTPNPSTWAVVPTATSSTSITMTATTATDPSGGVQYLFRRVNDGYLSGWQSSPEFTAVDLMPDTSYTYKVRSRDSLGNMGEFSETWTVSTFPAPDTTPPAAPLALPPC